MRAKLSDVAAAAGVSTSTVSLVLNDRARRIPAATREKVRRAAAEVGYSPNALARSLRTRRTRTVGLISDRIATTPYAGRLLSGAQDVALSNDHLVVLVNTDGDREIEVDAVATLASHQVDAMIYAAMWHRLVPVPEGLPPGTVFLDCRPDGGGFPAVVPDDERGGRAATEVLLAAGHRRIAYIDADEEDLPIASGLRLSGYRAALTDAGVTPDAALHVRAEVGAAGGRSALAHLMARPAQQRPTGIFCFNDRIASGVYSAAHRAGLEIPRDLSVVGYDDQQLIAAELDPPLTTVALPHEAMGQWATEVALGIRTVEQDGEIYRMECPVVHRSSVGPPLTSITSASDGPTATPRGRTGATAEAVPGWQPGSEEGTP